MTILALCARSPATLCKQFGVGGGREGSENGHDQKRGGVKRGGYLGELVILFAFFLRTTLL